MEVSVRRAEPGDAEAVSRLFDGPCAVSGTLQLPYPSVEAWRRRISPSEGIHSLVAVLEGEVVGELGLVVLEHPRRRHVGEIGMAVRDDRQGLGAGRALLEAALELADRWIGLSRIELQVYTDNERAISLYERSGFVVEGTHRSYALRDGRFVDAYSMARLRTDAP
ncbi:GNAT family N-acetyltransferase [Rubrobacter marinus]|uniref:GNAT family N-acetyltransferase n=1 Tax=Rubrobacter marinus TaxID=2653852 RepID=A0A6G8PXM7_9ACTN|nr:GNAT family N-acetyltransferase [Rubrobacter marinus]QIN78984.1 GNAT family N-acetyltransferase [Rubrobacter marinus]